MPNHAKAIEAAGLGLDLCWQNSQDLPPIEFTDAERERLAAAAITAFLRTVEVSTAMEMDGVDAWHDASGLLDDQLATTFKAMSATLANEVEQGDVW